MDANDTIFGPLNPQQRLAVSQLTGPLLILAGPGSGKTRVLVHRISNLIANDVFSGSICALTFTNKAADEMKKRLAAMAPDNQVWSGTFHKFCARLLRIHAPMIGLEENFTIYDSGDAKKVVKQAIVNAEVGTQHYSPDRVANEISNIKNAGLTVAQYQPRPGYSLDAILERVYPEYQKLLRLANGVDFDDLLLYCVDLLTKNPELRSALDARYRYMLVDEYQDTNTAQYQLIRLLNQDYQNLAVTGDPDQSIYGWRGANLNNILNFEKDYPNVKVVRLEQNYRSTKSILQVADQVITNNRRRMHKTLRTDNEQGKPVRLVSYPAPQDEATDIVDSIVLAVQKQQRQPRDFAILYRTNWLSRSLEHALRAAQIPYQIINGHEFYQRKEIKDTIGYLHLLNNPRDNVALVRVINTPPRKIGKITLERLQKFALDHEISLLEAARRIDEIDSIKNSPSKRITDFVTLYDRLAEVRTAEVQTIIKAVLEETGYRDWLTDDGSEEGYERANNVDELIVAAQEFDAEFNEMGGLERYLEQAALVSDTDVWESQADFVTLMTLHGAKGLEFPAVYIVGLEEGILPHERSSKDDAEVEEERRLLFVGLTRAQQELQISRCLNRFRRGSSWPVIPSRFLMEFPRDEMDVFQPGRQPENVGSDFDAEEVADLVADIDPWLHDGIPEIDIHALPPGNVDQPRLFENDLDDGEEDILDRIQETQSTAKFPRIMTATQLQQEQEASASIRLHPSRYESGMEVEHTDYGIGTITDLSGDGQKRTATIEFPGQGKKRIRLAFCNLRVL